MTDPSPPAEQAVFSFTADGPGFTASGSVTITPRPAAQPAPAPPATVTEPAPAPAPPPAPVPAAFHGATVTPGPWPKGTSWLAAYQDWTAATGHKPGAGKLYWTPDKLPKPGSLGEPLKAYQQLGIVPILCFSHLAADGSTPLGPLLGYLAGQFPAAYLVFNQEGNNPHYTADEHAAYHDIQCRYYPVARQAAPAFPVLYCPSGPGMRPQDYPGPEGCDGVAPDCYATSGKYPGIFAAAEALADGDQLPAGVGWLEMGVTASPGTTMTPDKIAAYFGFAAAMAARRKAAGQPCGPFAWWNGGVTGVANTLVPLAANPAIDYVLPAWSQFCASLEALA